MVFANAKHAAHAFAAHREPQVEPVLLSEHRYRAWIVEVAHHLHGNDVIMAVVNREVHCTKPAAP